MTDPSDNDGDEFTSLRHSLPSDPEEKAPAGPGLGAQIQEGLTNFFAGLSEATRNGLARLRPAPKEEVPAEEEAEVEPEPEPAPEPEQDWEQEEPEYDSQTDLISARLGLPAEPENTVPHSPAAPTVASQPHRRAAPVPEEDPTFIERFQNSITEMDPRLVVGVGITALGLVAIVGFLVLFSLARNRPNADGGTQVVMVTGNPTTTLGPATLTATLTPLPNMSATLGPSPTIDLTGTVTNLPVLRFGTLSEIKGTVQVRSDTNAPWKTVNEVLTIVPGTSVLTGENSSVRIELSGGAIIRLSSQTQFTLSEMSGTASRANIVLNLDFGKLWAIVTNLGEGIFEIHTPTGVAAVRGTYISTEHNTTDQLDVVTCLEGNCSYRNDNGQVSLHEDQQTESQNGNPPSSPHPMDASQLADWAKNIPEVLALTPTLVPTLTPPPTKTKLPSNTPGPSRTPTTTLTPSKTLTATVTASKTSTGTITATYTFTATKTATATFTKTNTQTPSKTPTPSLTPSQTFTPSQTNTATDTSVPPTNTDTSVPPTATDTDTSVPPTATDTDTSVPPTNTDTPMPSDTPTNTPTP